jgi:hypothetical protein
MATVVKDYDPFQTMGKDFDFGRVFDGQIWELVYGVDFDNPPTSMRSRLLYHAQKLGVEARIMLRKKRIFVQAIRK